MRTIEREMSKPFRILSLSGGGVRGIFQAAYLLGLQRELGQELKDGFDLIAGTSTGAIIALAFALGTPLSEIVAFYKERSDFIFESRFMSGIRQGAKYSSTHLRQALTEILGNKTLEDSDKCLIVAAATLDRFQHRIFSNLKPLSASDGILSAVDVALASAAAPTYFSPVQPHNGERTYVDGGVWANSPSLLAVLVAHRHLNIPFEDIRVLSIGTGYFPNGRSPRFMQRLRPFSLNSVRTVLELIWDSQASFADEYAKGLIPPSHFRKVDVPLNKNMKLDDVKEAIAVLPPLAESQAAATASDVRQEFLNTSVSPMTVRRHIPPASLIAHQIPAAGLTAFYPTRQYYRLFRVAATVDAYVGTAQKSVVMISINLMTGVPFNGLCDMLTKKLESTDGFSAVISLIDPEEEYLMSALAPVLSMTASNLRNSIQGTLERLRNLKQELVRSARERFVVRAHKSIPLGSAILLDHKESYGRIQIETKIYKAPFEKSFAFEVVPTEADGFYATLAKGYEDLLNDGRIIF